VRVDFVRNRWPALTVELCDTEASSIPDAGCKNEARVASVSDGNEMTVDLGPTGAAHAPDSGPAPAVGQVLRDRYVLTAELGTGGKGVVFKAYDRLRAALPEGHQDVALKVLHVGHVGDDSAEQTLAELGLEFHCTQLLSHRNVVNVHELDRDGDVVFFTMELLDGEPLSNVIERLRPGAMGRAEAWQLIHQLGSGLAHAHERGVVHGDLKPRNIFITREGELRILDFGSGHDVQALESRSEQGGHGRASGTPAYASCEQLEGRPADARDDLYALACICYELLAGTHPFDSWPATLARDYRMKLVRPRGLGGGQWRTLQRGLSWHRAGRSMSVRSWMQRLTREKEPQHPLTPLLALTQPSRQPRRILQYAPACFMLMTVMMTGAALTWIAWPSASAPTTVNTSYPPLAGDEKEIPGNEGRQISSTQPDAVSSAPSVPAATENSGPDPGTSDPGTSDPGTSDAGTSAGKDAAAATPHSRTAVAAASFVMSVNPSQVSSEDHFAEIRLHRNLLQRDGAFTWWTEPATAKPNVDYVPEAAAIQTFPNGYRAARLYVRLLPQPLRSQPSYFYIAIAKLDPSHRSAAVIRKQVWLPASDNLQAQR
jgi:serine/threonine protein kinase